MTINSVNGVNMNWSVPCRLQSLNTATFAELRHSKALIKAPRMRHWQMNDHDGDQYQTMTKLFNCRMPSCSSCSRRKWTVAERVSAVTRTSPSDRRCRRRTADRVRRTRRPGSRWASRLSTERTTTILPTTDLDTDSPSSSLTLELRTRLLHPQTHD